MLKRGLLCLGLTWALLFCRAASAEETVLFEKQSPYNTILVTEDDRGLRTLRFEKDGARQTVVKPGDPDHIELPYPRVMFAGLAFVEKPQRVLAIGLGGGTLPSFLRKHYPKMTIDVVDIDPDVVDVAKRFFGFREDAAMHAYVDDGRRFIETCGNTYDIIFLDAYNSDNIPYRLATREFLQAVQKALTPRGIVVGNVWSGNSSPLYRSMIRTYQDVFDELFILDVQDTPNKILIALPGKRQVKRTDLICRAREISQQEQFPFDIGDFLEYGARRAAEVGPPARILTDETETPNS